MRKPLTRSLFRSPHAVWYLLSALLLLRLVYSAGLDLVPDEAYYWDWSRNLSWGYFDHPPMVAWLTALSTSLLGTSLLGIKAVPVVGSALICIFALLLAKEYCRGASSLIFLLLAFNLALISGIGTLLLTPDIPLVLFWAISLYLLHRCVYRPFTACWPLLGLAAGCGLLSKYTFFIFFAAAALFLAITAHRRLLLTPRPWISVLVAIIVFLPNLVWNHAHDWVSLAFQMRHGLSSSRWPRLDTFGEYLGGQLGVVTPLLFVAVVIATVRALRCGTGEREKLLFLVVFTVVPFAAFAVSSLGKRVEPNWPAPAYTAGFVVLAWLWDRTGERHNRGLRRYLLASIAVAGVITTAILVHLRFPFLPLPPRKDTTLQIRGWREFGREVGGAVDKIDPEGKSVLCANRYQETALLAFYVPGRPRTLSLNFGTRKNHYHLLPRRSRMTGAPVIFAQKLSPDGLGEAITANFRSIHPADTIYLRRNPAPDVAYVLYRGELR